MTAQNGEGMEKRETNRDSGHRLDQEFGEPVFTELTRRSFLKLTGFGLAASLIPGCSRGPSEKLIPYLDQPEGILAGKATWYATTCGGCNAGCGMLAKNMDGRPIKLEGNPGHPISGGGLCPIGQAMVLPLYDAQRLQTPIIQGEKSDWGKVDREIRDSLAKIKRSGGSVRFLTGSLTSPTEQKTIQEFLSDYPGSRHVCYDPLSQSAILDAHLQTHGVRRFPGYDFGAAEWIVSFDADFLGTWISPVQFTAGYQAGRILESESPRLSQHLQFESRLSLTGSNADQRIAVSPEQINQLITALAARIAAKAGQSVGFSSPSLKPDHKAKIDELADSLWKSRGRSLVVCGLNQFETQVQVNLINHLLGNYEKTLSLLKPSNQCQGNDRDLAFLVDEIEKGKVSALFVLGVNPVYDLPGGEGLAQAIKKIPCTVSFATHLDETARVTRYVCPVHNPLESWRDAEPIAGKLSVTQPTIRPLGKTRAMVVSLTVWMGNKKEEYQVMKDTWRTDFFKRQKTDSTFGRFWDRALHDGWVEIDSPVRASTDFNMKSIQAVPKDPVISADKLSLVLYPKIGMLAGQHAHNPWLHELPDPVSKIVWDNEASLSPETARKFKVEQGDRIEIRQGEKKLVLPVHIQPGQYDGVVAVALGYGRVGTDRFTRVGPQWLESLPTVAVGETVGKNATLFLSLSEGRIGYSGSEVSIRPTGEHGELVTTQIHHSLSVPAGLAMKGMPKRPFVQETTLEEYKKNPESGSHPVHPKHDLWAGSHEYTGHHWGMIIDLAACTGCSACVVACQAENNIPVVGKDEVRLNREMHWMRIDRYYNETSEGTDVVHQPMFCQQCDHAPCETVCPVLATVHSSEGLNQQVYNRCVGTRYCSNNCPYKVRRFNWFDYPREDRLQNMSLNPDVTVRSRGVMEKCTFCVQRIQAAKSESASSGKPLVDGDIQTACQQSCPAGAVFFGDLNDEKGLLAKLKSSPRRYRVLDDLGVEPSVGYLRVVRNRPEPRGVKHHD
ncbi:MAG: 4Fe-4S dicluster domain-containing protein [Planctomycetota bacterium]|nr:4Fe-4S dicluster domain-containing protein [Planctomycetota bacterium]